MKPHGIVCNWSPWQYEGGQGIVHLNAQRHLNGGAVSHEAGCSGSWLA